MTNSRMCAAARPRSGAILTGRPDMDRTRIREHLAKVEEHAVRAEEHVRHQRRIVTELAQHGHDAQLARRILEHMEALLALHIEDRERLTKLLSDERL